MKRHIIFCIAASVALVSAGSFDVGAAHAAGRLILTEIMYDAPGTDSGREWIEVQNAGTSSVDLSTWRLFEANTNHKISAAVGSNGATSTPDLAVGGFAIIADVPDKFMADNPTYRGLLFDSAFSLSNDGEPLALHDETLAESDAVSYQPGWGAAGDGNTLQKSAGGVWISAPATPGAATTASASEPPLALPGDTATTTDSTAESPGGSAEEGGVISTHSSQEAATVSYSAPEFEITAGRPRIGFVGAPLSFEARVKRSKDIPPGTGMRSAWSFGDGGQAFDAATQHVYEFPGQYAVVVNCDSGGAHAVARVAVKIIEPRLSISFTPAPSPASPASIEVANLDTTEINIGGFIVEDAQTHFIVPRDTIIAPHLSIRLPSDLTGIAQPTGFVRIAAPSGRILASAPVASLADPLIAIPDGMTSADIRFRIESALGIYKR